MVDVAKAGFDLKTVTRDELIQIKGISFKTANCFLMHSRKDARCAALDTHLLKFLKAMGCSDVPSEAPQSLKKHTVLEKYFLDICDRSGFSPADLDLIAWRIYAYHPHHADYFVRCLKHRVSIYKHEESLDHALQ
jgi:thermostable 8-oxoguanine DNA glycosylase